MNHSQALRPQRMSVGCQLGQGSHRFCFRRGPIMSKQSELAGWLKGIAFAMPAIGLFLTGKHSDGWVSTASLVLLFAYVLLGGAYGLVTGVRDWHEMEDEFDRKGDEAAQDDET